jgi:flagellar L-ring protein precursor FlgH
VTIVDRLPNENLLIAGRRKVTIDGDTRTLLLTGVVRAIDVTTNNTISSRLVSQLELSYENEGVESKFLNQGWMGKKFNKWWPF